LPFPDYSKLPFRCPLCCNSVDFPPYPFEPRRLLAPQILSPFVTHVVDSFPVPVLGSRCPFLLRPLHPMSRQAPMIPLPLQIFGPLAFSKGLGVFYWFPSVSARLRCFSRSTPLVTVFVNSSERGLLCVRFSLDTRPPPLSFPTGFFLLPPPRHPFIFWTDLDPTYQRFSSLPPAVLLLFYRCLSFYDLTS